MTAGESTLDIYVETGVKRVLAVAVDWPGWCRGGKDEESALNALLQAAPRYADIVKTARLHFPLPRDPAALTVCERFQGNVATDMGIPERILPSDAELMDEGEVARASRLLRACWDAFDRTVHAAQGKELRKGPRGGGRELEGIMRHVLEAESGYSRRIGVDLKLAEMAAPDLSRVATENRLRLLEGLAEVAPAGTPPPGPRGGARWPARYFVRRVAYHVVDHTWEIEDRLQPSG